MCATSRLPDELWFLRAFVFLFFPEGEHGVSVRFPSYTGEWWFGCGSVPFIGGLLSSPSSRPPVLYSPAGFCCVSSGRAMGNEETAEAEGMPY